MFAPRYFAPRYFAPRFFSDGAASGAVMLVVQAASHGHTAESPSLTQANTLAVADALHSHSADSPTLSVGAAVVLLHPNHHLLKADGTLTEITDWTSGQATVDDPTGIQVGDLVEIRRNSGGDPPVHIIHPAALADGRLAVQMSAGPFGRNYARNPWFSDWPEEDHPPVYVGRVDSTDTGGVNSIDLKDLPASTLIPDESVIWVEGQDGVTTVDGDQTTSGSGTIVLALDSDYGGTENDDVIIWTAPTRPDHWSTIQGSTENPTGFRTPTFWRRDLGTPATDVSADVSAAWDPGSDPWRLTLKNIPLDTTVQPGDVISKDATGARATVVDHYSGIGGTQEFRVWPDNLLTWSVDDAVTIVRADFSALAEADEGMLFQRQDVLNDQTPQGILSGPFTVLHHPGWSLRVFVTWGVWNPSPSAQTFNPGGSSAGSLRVVLVEDTDIGNFLGLANGELASTEFAAQTVTTVEQRVDFATTATDIYRVRIEPFRSTGTLVAEDLMALPISVAISYGPSAHDLVGVEVSDTNRIVSRAVGELLSRRAPLAMELQMRDVAYLADQDAARHKIVLGAPWTLAGVFGIEGTPGGGQAREGVVRVARYVHDLVDLTKARVILAHDIFRSSDGG